jgi:hypothetical protein
VRTVMPGTVSMPSGRGYRARAAASASGEPPWFAGWCNVRPSLRKSAAVDARQSRAALRTTASKTGWVSVREDEITPRIADVAFSRSRLSASRCVRSPEPAPPDARERRAGGRFLSAFGLARAARRGIGDRLGERACLGKGEWCRVGAKGDRP